MTGAIYLVLPAAFPAVEEMGLGSCLALAYPPLTTCSAVRNTAVMFSPPLS